MDFEFTEEQRMIKNNVQRFLEKEIQPLIEEHERERKFVSKEIMKKLTPFKFVGGLLPEEVGGGGLDYTTYFLIIEELAKVWGSLRGRISITNAVLTHIYEYGNDQQKEAFLGPLLAGDTIGFFGLTEPNVGSDTASIQTTVALRSKTWVLNGTKTFITNGLDAEIGLVIAQTDKTKGINGTAAFIVEKEKTQYLTRPIEKMGMHCCPTAEIVFEDAQVPAENLLGRVGDGLRQGLKFLNEGRVLVAFVCTGTAQACVDAAIKYARERVQFGKTIGSFQLIQAKIADMLTLTNAMRLLCLQASSMMDKGLPCRKEASMAKLFASEEALKVAEQAIQIHGGYGYSQEFPVERYYRDIRHLTIAEGTSEIQRLFIGREILGVSAFK